MAKNNNYRYYLIKKYYKIIELNANNMRLFSTRTQNQHCYYSARVYTVNIYAHTKQTKNNNIK